uniref:Uncharacterized protein n=1 Tax=Siphoviridae sp. ctbrg2 TaxID=2823589 RepID=A0A8S5LGF6_9CAUD|nr:MAG TPA: hypothetical protein [Siphoviridae sp. ctbrg2]
MQSCIRIAVRQDTSGNNAATLTSDNLSSPNSFHFY